jgi:KaiC/GvpD/RAD55 family RecA-like ATPase
LGWDFAELQAQKKLQIVFTSPDDELGAYPGSQLTSEAAEFLVDTVIRVKRTLHNRRIHRSIEIVKSRGRDYDFGEHTFGIRDGKGLKVFRRVQVPLPFKMEQPTSKARRSVIGVDAE